MADATWFLGPLGDLRPLSCPESGVSMQQQRFGGVHQGLTGARVVDFTGTRMQYNFEFKWLEADEWGWLDALNTRHVPGPLYLLDPFKKNRLSVHATNLRKCFSDYVPGENYAFQWTVDRDIPTQLPYSSRSILLSSWVASQTQVFVRFNPTALTPVTPGEQITGSIYLKAQAAGATGTLFFNYFDRDGVALASVSQDATLLNSWQRFSITRTIPANVAALRLSYRTNSRTGLRFAGPQVELQATPTAFEPGGGAPKVLMDQLETTSPRFPLRDASLTLLEA